jgi:hypothetical protein
MKTRNKKKKNKQKKEALPGHGEEKGRKRTEKKDAPGPLTLTRTPALWICCTIGPNRLCLLRGIFYIFFNHFAKFYDRLKF